MIRSLETPGTSITTWDLGDAVIYSFSGRPSCLADAPDDELEYRNPLRARSGVAYWILNDRYDKMINFEKE